MIQYFLYYFLFKKEDTSFSCMLRSLRLPQPQARAPFINEALTKKAFHFFKLLFFNQLTYLVN